ncbi:MAG: hypothetical protein J5654_02295 [Victivallales bacterium]|nr:hypothetical protein [Victivallales bacterium]
MCELMTIAAAVIFTVLYFRFRSGTHARSLFNTMMMFWGAALMWSVDCVFSLMEGEGLFDISGKDTLLGGIILVCGLVFFAVSALVERKHSQAGA